MIIKRYFKQTMIAWAAFAGLLVPASADATECLRLDIDRLNGAPSELVSYTTLKYLEDFVSGECSLNQGSIGRFVDMTYLSERLTSVPSSSIIASPNYVTMDGLKVSIAKELKRNRRVSLGVTEYSARDIGVFLMLACQITSQTDLQKCPSNLKQVSGMAENWSFEQKAKFAEPFITAPKRRAIQSRKAHVLN